MKPTLDTLVFVGKDGSLQRQQPGFPNEIIAIGPEPWIAWVNAQDSGLGLHLPHVQEATTYRVRNGNAGDCSYLAPLQTFALKPGLIFEYEVTLAIGTVDQLRSVFGKLSPPK